MVSPARYTARNPLPSTAVVAEKIKSTTATVSTG